MGGWWNGVVDMLVVFNILLVVGGVGGGGVVGVGNGMIQNDGVESILNYNS